MKGSKSEGTFSEILDKAEVNVNPNDIWACHRVVNQSNTIANLQGGKIPNMCYLKRFAKVNASGYKLW